MFRSGKEKNLFIISVSLIFILFFLAMFFINKSYALPVSSEFVLTPDIREESDKPVNEMVNREEINNSVGEIKIIPMDKNKSINYDEDVKKFGVIIQSGKIFPQIINLEKDDKVCLSLTALDADYDFRLVDYNINEHLSHGETKEVFFQANSLGTFEYSSYDNNTYLSSGELIINNN